MSCFHLIYFLVRQKQINVNFRKKFFLSLCIKEMVFDTVLARIQNQELERCPLTVYPG